MSTFAELLKDYQARTGVSDAELARAIGVRRQTIFRWKEGQVARPRAREDVLRCAAKLRLTPVERDGLLIAAGFPPEQYHPVLRESASETREQGGPANTFGDDDGSDLPPLPDGVVSGLPTAPIGQSVWRRRWITVGVVGVLVCGLVVLLLLAPFGRSGLRIQGVERFPVASAGERLVLIGRTGNLDRAAGDDILAGPLAAAVDREIAANRITNTRAAVWPAVIGPPPHSLATVQLRTRASLVVSASVRPTDSLATVTIVAFESDQPATKQTAVNNGGKDSTTSPGRTSQAITPVTLVIQPRNAREVRLVATWALARLLWADGQTGEARALLTQCLGQAQSLDRLRGAVEADLVSLAGK